MARVSRERFGTPSRLDDCRRAGDDGAELFVVEGESAAAAVARVRDADFQAVLPMQGKPLNATRATRAKLLAHPLFGPLVDAVGTGIEPDYRATSLRYGRILLLMDPDADGIHCGVLLLLFFRRWMPQLIAAGRIGIVRPPESVPATKLIWRIRATSPSLIWNDTPTRLRSSGVTVV